LDAKLAGHYGNGLIFMQDNASINTAYKVQAWFKEQGIPMADWPPYLLDLNPIKHLCYGPLYGRTHEWAVGTGSWHLRSIWLRLQLANGRAVGPIDVR